MSTLASNSDQPKVKRQKMAGKQSMRDVPANEFTRMIDYYEGPMVYVYVGGISYRLSKSLLCHFSTLFNGAFNGHFIEGETQKLDLDCSNESFELAIQWMYTGHAVLSPTVVSNGDKLSRLLDFLKLADFLQLTGPFTSTNETIRQIFKINDLNPQSKHIKEAMKLPPGSQARNIVLRACVGPYLQSLGWSYSSNSSNTPRNISDFRFKTELKELDGFAAELFQLFDDTVRKQRSQYGESMVSDPATGESMCYK